LRAARFSFLRSSLLRVAVFAMSASNPFEIYLEFYPITFRVRRLELQTSYTKRETG
jgi:hypothetical protein